MIVVNSPSLSVALPEQSNVIVVHRENKGYGTSAQSKQLAMAAIAAQANSHKHIKGCLNELLQAPVAHHTPLHISAGPPHTTT